MLDTDVQGAKISHYFEIVFFMIISLVFTFSTFAEGKKLTYKQVYMKGGEKLTKTLPYIKKWSDDNYYIQAKKVKKGKKFSTITEKVNAKTGEIHLVKSIVPGKNFPADMKLSDHIKNADDGSSFLFIKKGDLFHYSLKSDEFKRLTKTPSEKENNATFSPDGKYVAYTKSKDLYIVNINSNKHIRITSDGSDVIFNGWASWIYYEEILGRRSRYKSFWWSPDSKNLAFFRFDNSKMPKFTITNSKGVHGKVEVTSYPKPGDPPPKVTIGTYHLENKKTIWAAKSSLKNPYYAKPVWTPDSRTFFLQEINRGQDHLSLFSVNINSGAKKKIYEEKQKSWIDFYDDIYFLKKNRGFLILSDVDGWSHIYYYRMDGKLKKRLTKGDWRAKRITKIDEKRGFVYFTGFKDNSTDNHLFRVGLNGRGLKQLSTNRGYHRFLISPESKYYIDTYSNIDHPSVRNIYKMNGKLVRKAGNSLRKISKEYNLGKTELFTIPSGDGYDLPAKWILPPDFDKTKKYPVLFIEYGGPDSGSVRNSHYSLSNFYLSQEGIIVFSVDHRGSGHFGKKGVALMHRSLGKWEMNDYISAVKWLREKPFIDPEKIAITGGSYGGYVTAMALTYGADYFTHGIASYSVTDWRLYDSFYTEKFMDTPEENPEGYKKGSVMEYAENLKGTLLIVHGTMDDNVHLQNSLQLVSKLQDLNKEFSMMFYPGGRHGWGGKKRVHFTRSYVQFWFKHLLGRDLDINKD